MQHCTYVSITFLHSCLYYSLRLILLNSFHEITFLLSNEENAIAANFRRYRYSVVRYYFSDILLDATNVQVKKIKIIYQQQEALKSSAKPADC